MQTNHRRTLPAVPTECHELHESLSEPEIQEMRYTGISVGKFLAESSRLVEGRQPQKLQDLVPKLATQSDRGKTCASLHKAYLQVRLRVVAVGQRRTGLSRQDATISSTLALVVPAKVGMHIQMLLGGADSSEKVWGLVGRKAAWDLSIGMIQTKTLA